MELWEGACLCACMCACKPMAWQLPQMGLLEHLYHLWRTVVNHWSGRWVMRMDGWKEPWGSKPVMSQVRSHQKFWNPREVFIRTFLCPAPRLKGCGSCALHTGPPGD